MKKIIIIAFLIIILSITCFGGSFLSYFDRFGIKGGLSISNSESQFYYNSKNMLMPTITLFAEKDLRNNILFSTGIYYVRKGARDNYYTIDYTTYQVIDITEYKHTLDYAGIPIILKYNHIFKYFNLYSITGIGIEFLVNYNSEVYEEFLDTFNKTNLSFILGAGLELKFNEESIGTIEFRIKRDLNYQEDQYKTKNYSYQIVLGRYVF